MTNNNAVNIIAETDRLIIRTVTLEDATDSFEIYGDAEVMKFVDGSPPYENIERSELNLKRGMEYQNIHGISHWGMIEKSSNKFIGHCGFNLFENGPEFELVAHVNRKYWNMGFATEAAKACIDHAFSCLNTQTIVGLVEPENIGSVRLLEKLKMVYDSEVEEDGIQLKLYKLHNPSE